MGVASVDEDDAGADAFGVEDAGAGFDAESFGLVTGGDEGGGVGHGWDDAGGLAAVLGVELLFYGGEEAVEVDVQEAELVGLEVGGHEMIIFAWCSPASFWVDEAG